MSAWEKKNVPMEPEFNGGFLKSNGEFLDLYMIFHFKERKNVSGHFPLCQPCLKRSER